MDIVETQKYTVPVDSRHTVSPGQTLDHIAQIHGVTVDQILQHPGNNHVQQFGGALMPGTRIWLPNAGGRML
jgi:LysM repeat protein